MRSRTRSIRTTARVAAGGALAAAVVLATATAALAHVTVQPKQAAPGGFATIAFQVPNELPNASTVKVKVQFPADHPLAFVSVKPKAGWTYNVEKKQLPTPIKTDDGTITEAVSTITWEGGKIGPGEFDDFPVSVGPLPTDVPELAFPAIQTYDNGQEVAWIEKPGADGKEPEHPAPTLKLVAAGAATAPAAGNTDSHDAADSKTTGSTKTSVVTAAASENAAATTSSSSSSSNALGIAALVVGVLALILALAAFAAARTKSASS